jgi:uncharacterized protein YecE (DUF72 family)
MIYVGTAAWSIPKIAIESFPAEGTHLEKYSQVLNCVEINSSFYKDHLAKTYKRWADSTPQNFKFSVKLNKRFTHECNLEIDVEDLRNNLKAISELGQKWGVLLLQFAAGQEFDFSKMKIFYRTVRENYLGPVALEARNMGWMSEDAIGLMREFTITKVTADPEKCPVNFPGEIKYYRLHGSPEIYKSDYDDELLNRLYDEMEEFEGDVWCIFDNTTFGYATNNAVTIMKKGEEYERYQRQHENGTPSVYALDEY